MSAPDALATDAPCGRLELVHALADGPVPTGVATDGHLYVTADQLHRQAQCRGGTDERRYPYALFRTPVGAGPVRLR